jgi:hypothetical protein
MKKLFAIVGISILAFVLLYLISWILLYQYNSKNYNSYGLLIRSGSTCNYYKYKVKDCKVWGWGKSPDDNYDKMAAHCDGLFGRWNVIYSKSRKEVSTKPDCSAEIELKCTEDGEYWLYQRWGQMFIGKFTLFGAEQSFCTLNLMKK